MAKVLIVGLSGKKRSGKDTVCEMMGSMIPVVRLAFADHLKDEVAQACNVDRSFMEAHKDNFRLILQGWSTDFKRELLGQDYWINRLRPDVESARNLISTLPNKLGVICITDVRFPNEYNFVAAEGGVNIRVVRPDGSLDPHPSETALDGHVFEFAIHNNGTIENLRKTVRYVVDGLVKLHT